MWDGEVSDSLRESPSGAPQLQEEIALALGEGPAATAARDRLIQQVVAMLVTRTKVG